MAKQRLSVDREQARMLVQTVGYQIASQKLGVKECTLRQWNNRFNWNATTPHKQASAIVTTVKPPDALSQVFTELESKSKLSLARAVNRLAKDSETATLRDSGHVKDVAQTFAIVHPQDQTKSTILNIGVLIGSTEPEPPLLKDCNNSVTELS